MEAEEQVALSALRVWRIACLQTELNMVRNGDWLAAKRAEESALRRLMHAADRLIDADEAARMAAQAVRDKEEHDPSENLS